MLTIFTLKKRVTTMNLTYMIAQWAVILMIRVPLILIGLITVPIALLDSRLDNSTTTRFTEHNAGKYWSMVRLPKWAWIWSNDRDGALGDKRGWWDAETDGAYTFWSMFKWLAIRNPVNNLGFLPFFSCDVTKSKITVIGGSEIRDYKLLDSGWQWLKAYDGVFNYYHFYYLSENWYIRMGHKIKFEHRDYRHDERDPTKSLKSFTFRVRKL